MRLLKHHNIISQLPNPCYDNCMCYKHSKTVSWRIVQQSNKQPQTRTEWTADGQTGLGKPKCSWASRVNANKYLQAFRHVTKSLIKEDLRANEWVYKGCSGRASLITKPPTRGQCHTTSFQQTVYTNERSIWVAFIIWRWEPTALWRWKVQCAHFLRNSGFYISVSFKNGGTRWQLVKRKTPMAPCIVSYIWMLVQTFIKLLVGSISSFYFNIKIINQDKFYTLDLENKRSLFFFLDAIPKLGEHSRVARVLQSCPAVLWRGRGHTVGTWEHINLSHLGPIYSAPFSSRACFWTVGGSRAAGAPMETLGTKNVPTPPAEHWRSTSPLCLT